MGIAGGREREKDGVGTKRAVKVAKLKETVIRGRLADDAGDEVIDKRRVDTVSTRLRAGDTHGIIRGGK
jgi:hypothetical protein